MDNSSILNLNNYKYSSGPIVYWMSRDQRVEDNWALIRAYELAAKHKTELRVVFCKLPKYLKTPDRNYAWMLKGLEKVSEDLFDLNIHFDVIDGNPVKEIPKYIEKYRVGGIISDFSPLKNPRKWKEEIAKQIKIPFEVVDTHNIIPVWITSDKQEYGAYTIRPKIHKLLPKYLTDFPKIERFTQNKGAKRSVIHLLPLDPNLPTPGAKQSNEVLKEFILDIERYSQRNNPNVDGQSNLSPYLHFGQISAQRIALEISKLPQSEQRDSFLEELVVRRELSDNFCYYNPNYETFEGFPQWAKNTLNEHRNDRREYVYTLDELEQSKTHDQLWNTAQTQMVKYGKMHGYMRMYWGKKILEWTRNPEEALEYAIYLNNKYELDGRDPNGYTGIAWCIGGVHDRAWAQRHIFGKIRYMNYNGCKRKFNVEEYIKKYAN